MARPVLPLSGGCSCGAIRYEIASFPLLLYSCNCTDCQTASGSAFALNMPVATKAFRNCARRAESLAPRVADRGERYLMVLRRLRRAPLWRAQGPSGLDEPARRNARRHNMAEADRAHVHAQRANLGAARPRRGMPRGHAQGFRGAIGEMARDVAGILSWEITTPPCGRGRSRTRPSVPSCRPCRRRSSAAR